MAKKSKKETTDNPDKNDVNRVTIEAIEAAMKILAGRIESFQSVIDDMRSRGITTLQTSNWHSSGVRGMDLLRRATEAMWTAIGMEVEAARKIERMREKNAAAPAKRPAKD